MTEAVALDPSSSETAAYEALADHYLAEIARLQGQIARDRSDIDRLREETRAILAAAMESLVSMRAQ